LRDRVLPKGVGAPPSERQAAIGGARTSRPLTREEIDRVIVIVVITLFVSIFWAGYEQGGGLMNLFTDRSTDRHLLGYEIPTTWFQAVNSGFIFLLAPVFASLWPRLAESGRVTVRGGERARGVLAGARGDA